MWRQLFRWGTILERYDGVLGFSKTNIHFEEREFDRKLANGHAELVFGKRAALFRINIPERNWMCRKKQIKTET
jgi:hypothetical protein